MEDDMWSRMTLEDPWDTGELGRDEEFVKVVQLSEEQEKAMNNTVSQVDWNNAPEGAQFFAGWSFRKHEGNKEYHWTGDNWADTVYETTKEHQERASDFQMRPAKPMMSLKQVVKQLHPDAFAPEDTKHKTSIDFLDEVKAIQSQRAAEYEQDGGERSFAKVATVFNTYTGKDLQPSDIALMLEILKNVRFYSQDGYHSDSVVDKISYGSLWAELVTEERV